MVQLGENLEGDCPRARPLPLLPHCQCPGSRARRAEGASRPAARLTHVARARCRAACPAHRCSPGSLQPPASPGRTLPHRQGCLWVQDGPRCTVLPGAETNGPEIQTRLPRLPQSLAQGSCGAERPSSLPPSLPASSCCRLCLFLLCILETVLEDKHRSRVSAPHPLSTVYQRVQVLLVSLNEQTLPTSGNVAMTLACSTGNVNELSKGPSFYFKTAWVSFGSEPRPLIVLPFKAFLTTLQNPGLGLHFLEIPKTDLWKPGEDGL